MSSGGGSWACQCGPSWVETAGWSPLRRPVWTSRAADLYQAELAGRTTRQAQARVVELLAASGELRGDPQPIQHAVKFYEKGDRPLEIVTSRQWFFQTLPRRAALLERGRQLRWHPAYMVARYVSWVEGLNSDWLISRQRFFGVPFPVWYRLNAQGEPDYGDPVLPSEVDLPVDPSTDVPTGFVEAQRGQPGGSWPTPTSWTPGRPRR